MGKSVQRSLALALVALLAAGHAAGNASPENGNAALLATVDFGDPVYGFIFALCIASLLIGAVWRDRSGLTLCALCASSLGALLFADGYAYYFDVLRSLDLHASAVVLLSALALYSASRLHRVLTGRDALGRHAWRVLDVVEWTVIAVAIASVLVDKTWTAVLIRVLAVAGYAMAGVLVYAGTSAWRAGDRHALFLVAAWLWLLLAVAAWQFGILAGSMLAGHELHVAIGGALMLVAAGYIDRAMGYRNSWVRQRREAEQTGDLLRVERARRGFGDEVTRLLRALEPGDYEERILTKFLEHLAGVVPAAGSAVAISHRGEMRLVVLGEEGVRARFESILATREQLLQSVCLSDRAAVIHSDDLGIEAAGGSPSCMGIVPVQADRNEWAAVLLARSGELEFGLDELELVSDFAHQAYASVSNAQQFSRVRREAETDALTGIYNRRAVLTRAERCLRKSRSLRTPMAVLFVDVDRFKRINDQWGHETGDRALQHVASICSASLREQDFIGRYGGEEFLAVLPGATAEDAGRVAERLRNTVEDTVFEVDGRRCDLTVSVGVSDRGDQAGSIELDGLLRAADQALYRAKHDGRNRVVRLPLGVPANAATGPA